MLSRKFIQSIARRLRNGTAAGSVEHALLIALIAVGAGSPVAAIGRDGAAGLT